MKKLVGYGILREVNSSIIKRLVEILAESQRTQDSVWWRNSRERGISIPDRANGVSGFAMSMH